MTTLGVHRQQQAIDSLLAAASELPPGDPAQAYITQFACVRISGFIERAVVEIYYNYANARQPVFGRFASRRLDRQSNPNAENLCQLAGDFVSEWEAGLREFLEINGRRDAINSVVTNRHRIAHGETANFGLSQLREWYEKVLEYVRFVETQAGV